MRGAHRLARRALSLKAGRRPSTALAHTSSPEFLDQRLSKSTLEAATTDATGAVWLRWSDGAGGSFHPLWLRDNCPSVRHAASRQKLVSAAAISRALAVESVECEPERLRVRWHPDGHVSEFCAAWLRELGGSGDGGAVDAADAADAAGAEALASSTPTLPEFEYSELRAGGDAAAHQWLSALAAHGATLLRGVPCEEHRVAEVAELIGPLQPQIYGDTFDVRSEPRPINLAYTGEAIGPHMDLCYYESPPGLQLLHCMRFDDAVAGGESVLIDGFAVGERLRRDDPAAFETLARVPATFVKDHAQRENPVLMSYQRPHLALDGRRRLVGVFWSPPFEGPLRVAPADVGPYYDAYRALDAAIADAPAVRRRLRPGEMLVFNNRRMLHGRDAFGTDDGVRWLRGCYVCIDEFANKCNLLRRRFADADAATPRHLGNQDWGAALTALPPQQ